MRTGTITKTLPTGEEEVITIKLPSTSKKKRNKKEVILDEDNSTEEEV